MKNFSVYNNDNIINKNEDLICPICFYILKYPINCSDKNNSHSFCKECIDIYLKESNKCPICKNNFEYKINSNSYLYIIKYINFNLYKKWKTYKKKKILLMEIYILN